MSNLFEQPEMQALSDLEQKRAEIQVRLAEGGQLTPELRSAYERGLDILGGQIIDLVNSKNLQEAVISYSQSAVQNLEGLKPLEGILPDEEISALASSFEERLEAVRDFVSQYGEFLETDARTAVEQIVGEVAVSSVIDRVEAIEEEDSPLPVEPEEETDDYEAGDRVKLTLTQRDGVIQIGKGGKIVKLSEAAQRALAALLDTQPEFLKTKELKEAAGVTEMNSDAFQAQVIRHLSRLTYRKQPLVEKRGLTRGTRYGVSPRFDLELVKVEVKDLGKEQHLLDKGDIYIAVRHISTFSPLLSNLDVPTIDESLLEELKPYMPNYSHMRGNDEAIRAERVNALGRILDFMDDDNRFFTYLDMVAEEDPDYIFVRYLFDLENEQRELLKRIMTAVTVSREVTENGYYMVAYNPKDQPVATTGLITDRPPTPFTELVEKQTELPPQDPADLSPKSETEDSTDEANTGKGAVEPVAEKRKVQSAEQQQKLDKIRQAVEGVVDTWLLHFSAEKEYTRPKLENIFPSLTTRNVSNAAENNVLSSSLRRSRHRKLSLEEVVKVMIASDPELRNISTTSGLRRQISSLIKQVIEQKTAG